MAQNGEYVKTNGVEIYYESFGHGEPLLLLHGFTVSHVVWMPFVGKFSDNHGDRGEFFPVDIPAQSYKSIPNSFLWIVPNDGHIPARLSGNGSIWTEVFVQVANEFLEGNWNN